MTNSPNRYTPSTVDDVINLLGSMMLGATTFHDRTGYSPIEILSRVCVAKCGLGSDPATGG